MGTDTGEPRFVGSNSSPGPSEQPPPYQPQDPVSNSHSFSWKDFNLQKFWFHLRWSHLWFFVFSISSIAISIAVVSSCGEPSQADNRLVVISTPAFVGSDGVSNGYDYEYFGLDYLPDAYYIGLAGVCRDRDHHVTCVRHFPSRFNLTDYITADLDNSTLIERWDAFFHKQAYPYEGLVAKLSTAAGALLVCSILVGTISTVVIMCSKSGFSSSAILLLILDCAMLLAALCLWSSVFFIDFSINDGLGNTRPGGYLLQVIGLGSWLMLAAFLCRLLSQPVLLLGFVGLLVFLALLPLLVLIGCCAACAGDDGSSSSSTTRRYDSDEVPTRGGTLYASFTRVVVERYEIYSKT